MSKESKVAGALASVALATGMLLGGGVVVPGVASVALAVEGEADPVQSLPFEDVKDGEYYTEAVAFVYNAGLMTGYEGASLFGLYDPLTREQGAQVLYRALGMGDFDGDCGLADVDQGAWYATAVNWAVGRGVITGYADGSGLFGVGDDLSREQFATIIARVAQADVSKADLSVLDGFIDGNQVSDWARPYVAWAVQLGILEGSEDTGTGSILLAGNPITRVELAIMIQRAAGAGILPTA